MEQERDEKLADLVMKDKKQGKKLPRAEDAEQKIKNLPDHFEPELPGDKDREENVLGGTKKSFGLDNDDRQH
ncbi:unnamed protein product, partial [Mesorhabditis belari]|uniref:Uncharacterized protein n=1 Tax=Mesorhabditis belari TaxID=2138241 RepID=A0AAF3FKH7_9BILA